MSLAARLLALFGQTRGRSPERSAAEAEFKLLVALAQADGMLSASETAGLTRAAEHLIGADADVAALISDAQSSPVDELAAEVRSTIPHAARVDLMARATSLAAIDGDTSEIESANLERFARLLGVPADAGEGGS